MSSMVLSTLPGVGERLAQKITDHFGGESEAIASLKSGDIARIAEIDGVSPKRALIACSDGCRSIRLVLSDQRG